MGHILFPFYLLSVFWAYTKISEKIFFKFKEDLLCIRSKECLLKEENHVASLHAWREFVEDATPHFSDSNLKSAQVFLHENLIHLIPPDSDHPDGGPFDRASPFWCWLHLESGDEVIVLKTKKFKDCEE